MSTLRGTGSARPTTSGASSRPARAAQPAAGDERTNVKNDRLPDVTAKARGRDIPSAGHTRKGGPSYHSTELFRGATEIEIVHNGAIYLLKITRQGKLILNK
jgi:hemin uptake protein HemP